MLTAENLKGNWGTLLLPVNKDESIDFVRLGDEIDHLVEAKLDGIYSNGTAGEFHNQLEEEFDQVQELLAEKCLAAGMPFQVGASHPSPVVCLARVQRMVRLKPSAFQVILPDWVVASAEEQVNFLQRMAQAAAGIPLVLYNPPHAKLILAPADFQRLKNAVPSLSGIKVASGDSTWFSRMRLHMTGISVFVPGHLLASGFHQGVAAGSYSNMTCLNPAAAQRWWGLINEDIEAALDVENRIDGFFSECIIPWKHLGYSNPALDKFLAAVGGWCPIGTRLRWPYQWIPESEVAAVRKKAQAYLPEFFITS